MKNKWRMKREDSAASGRRFVPEELVMNIIKRIDDPSCVFRLRTLNKSWSRLLSSPNFLHSFLLFDHDDHNHNEDVRRRQIIVMRDHEFEIEYYFRQRRKVFSCLSYDTLQQTTPATTDFDCYPPAIDRYGHGEPLFPTPPDVTIVGSCHGILCLSIRHYSLSSPSDLILWNPTTSETKLLPPFPIAPFVRRRLHRHPGRSLMTFWENFGFGFHSTSADYKIVATVSWRSLDLRGDRLYLKRRGLCCWIYSMRDHKWTKFATTSTNTPSPFSYGDYEQASGTNNDDTCYWWSVTDCVRHVDKYKIMSFDMNKQSFKFVKVNSPDKLIGPPIRAESVSKLFVRKNSLMLIYETVGGPASAPAPAPDAAAGIKDKANRCYEIWTLLNYNNSELNTLDSSSGNWIRLYVLDPSLIITPILTHQVRHKRRIPGIWKDGYYFSVTSQGKLTVFNPESDQLRDLDIHGARSSFQLEVFTPSTVAFSELTKTNNLDDTPCCFNFFKRN